MGSNPGKRKAAALRLASLAQGEAAGAGGRLLGNVFRSKSDDPRTTGARPGFTTKAPRAPRNTKRTISATVDDRQPADSRDPRPSKARLGVHHEGSPSTPKPGLSSEAPTARSWKREGEKLRRKERFNFFYLEYRWTNDRVFI